ncbi:MAG: T9SS type A sorting domain-containing protein [Candidatus Kapabacteria bacterium]|nr:T9SS type A sorting domain-containing protein [Candidatus Kapabacteria bacterium]
MKKMLIDLKLLFIKIAIIVIIVNINSINLYCQIVWEKTIVGPPQPFQSFNFYQNKILKDKTILWLLSYTDQVNTDFVPREVPVLLKTDATGNIIWNFQKEYFHCVTPCFINEELNGDITIYNNWVTVTNLAGAYGFRPLIIKLKNDGSFISDNIDSNTTEIGSFNPGSSFLDKSGSIVNFGMLMNKFYFKQFDKNANFVKQIIIDSSFNSNYANPESFLLSNNDYLVNITYNGSPKQKYSFIRLDTNFKTKWKDTCSDTGRVVILKSKLLSDSSGFVSLGTIRPINTNDTTTYNFFLKKFDLSGNLISEFVFTGMFIYKGNNRTFLADYIETKDKGFLFVGSNPIGYSMNSNNYIIKFDSSGNKLYEKSWGPSGSCLFAISKNDKNDYCILGRNYLVCLNDSLLTNVFDINNKSNDLIISPNPTTDFLNISGLQGEAVQIFSIEGEKLMEIKPSEGFEPSEGSKIDISALPVGVYYLSVTTGTQRITKSFVVVR